jgi:hypothetical protein
MEIAIADDAAARTGRTQRHFIVLKKCTLGRSAFCANGTADANIS